MRMIIEQQFSQSSLQDLTQVLLLSSITTQQICQIFITSQEQIHSKKCSAIWTLIPEYSLIDFYVMYLAVLMLLFEKFLKNGTPGVFMMVILYIPFNLEFLLEDLT